MMETIADKLLDITPKGYRKAVLRAYFYGKTSYEIKYYVDMGDGKYIDCFYLSGINRTKLAKVFTSIGKDIAYVRNHSSNRWNSLAFTLYNDGNANINFDYIKYDDEGISNEESWKQKYLI